MWNVLNKVELWGDSTHILPEVKRKKVYLLNVSVYSSKW